MIQEYVNFFSYNKYPIAVNTIAVDMQPRATDNFRLILHKIGPNIFIPKPYVKRKAKFASPVSYLV